MQPIVHSEAEQNSIFTGLAEQMMQQGQLINVPQIPGAFNPATGTTPPPTPSVEAAPPEGSEQGTGGQKAPTKKDKAATPQIPNQMKPGANQSVTASVANTGQLIPIAPPTAPGSTGADDISDIKRLIGQLSGQQDNPAADTSSQQQKSGGDGGGFLDTVGDIVSVATSILAWIICTELMRQGKMPRKWWIKGAPIFAKYPEFVKQGYYLWAIPCVLHLRVHPNSWFSWLLCVVFNARAKSIAERRTIAGTAVTVVLWPICWFLGAVLWLLRKRPDWTSVYGVRN